MCCSGSFFVAAPLAAAMPRSNQFFIAQIVPVLTIPIVKVRNFPATLNA